MGARVRKRVTRWANVANWTLGFLLSIATPATANIVKVNPGLFARPNFFVRDVAPLVHLPGVIERVPKPLTPFRGRALPSCLAVGRGNFTAAPYFKAPVN
jgi:hypothetical protein